MRYIKSFSNFSESLFVNYFQNIDLKESLNVWHDVLLNSISAEKLDLFDTLKIPRNDLYLKMGIDELSDNIEFINSLSSLRLRKSSVENTDDYQTFVNKPCKFMFIYDSVANDLEEPIYLIFQTWTENLNQWSDVLLYKINDNIKKFYDKLSSKTIDIKDGDVNYSYQTSNGNEWQLKDKDMENDVYKKVFRKDELERLINDRNVKLTII